MPYRRDGSDELKEPKTTRQQKLAQCAIFWTDLRGHKLAPDRNDPFASMIWMELKDEDITIKMSNMMSSHSNGTSYVRVIYKSRVVLESAGDGWLGNQDVHIYNEGEWEKRVIAGCKNHPRLFDELKRMK